jgi:hypothetical protein
MFRHGNGYLFEMMRIQKIPDSVVIKVSGCTGKRLGVGWVNREGVGYRIPSVSEGME